MDTRRELTRILILTYVSAVCFVVSYLTARILLVLNHGFGTGDLNAFVYWSFLFAVFLILPADLFTISLRNLRTINRVGIGILFGGLLGFGWTVLNRWFLGPWFGAWSFNVLYCWLAGGAVSMAAAALIDRYHVSFITQSHNSSLGSV